MKKIKWQNVKSQNENDCWAIAISKATGLNVYVFHSKFNLTLTVGGDCVMTVNKKGTTYDDKFIREDKVSKIERLYIDTYGELE